MDWEYGAWLNRVVGLTCFGKIVNNLLLIELQFLLIFRPGGRTYDQAPQSTLKYTDRTLILEEKSR